MIEKISETQIKETIAQPDLVVITSLDDMLSEQASLQRGIENNKAQAALQQDKLDALNSKINEVQGLGIKTQLEVVSAELSKDVLIQVDNSSQLVTP